MAPHLTGAELDVVTRSVSAGAARHLSIAGHTRVQAHHASRPHATSAYHQEHRVSAHKFGILGHNVGVRPPTLVSLNAAFLAPIQ